MMTILTTLGKLTVPAAALSMAVFGMAVHTGAQGLTPADPVVCTIEVSDGPFGATLKGHVVANEDVRGNFTMQFSKHGSSSASITQSGGFDLDAGESATLGQASLGGSGSVEAELTLRFDGTTMICRTDGVIEL